MNLINTRFTPIFIMPVALVLSTCTINNIETTSEASAAEKNAVLACPSNDAQASCILRTAESVLANIENDFAWATSAAELALAHDALGDEESAWRSLAQSLNRGLLIEDENKRNTAIADSISAMATMTPSPSFKNLNHRLSKLVSGISDIEKQSDIFAKLVSAQSVHLGAAHALQRARKLPEETSYGASHKAMALRKIAKQFAAAGDFEAARETIDNITMGLPYYGIMAHTDVARKAIEYGKPEIAKLLIEQAIQKAPQQNDGYFIAAVLRDAAYSTFRLGEVSRSATLFEQAIEIAKTATKPNQQARAMSRVITRLADADQYATSRNVLIEASQLAKTVESESMRNFSYYEIAGSAAFSGSFAMARSILSEIPDTPFSSTSSLQSAVQRDLAWGLAKHGNKKDALITANTISSPRERVQALSRIVRILNNPSMEALPRYL